MPQLKHYTAKHAMRMDCGHTIQTGEAFHVASVFTCDREGSWPLKVLMACFTPKAKQEPHAVTAQPTKEQAAPSQPATQPQVKASTPVPDKPQA